MIQTVQEQVKGFRGNCEATRVVAIENITAEQARIVIDKSNENVKVYARLKEDIKVGDIGKGYKVTDKIAGLIGKTLEIHEYIKKERSEEDAQAKGLEAGMYCGYGCKFMNGERAETFVNGKLDETWLVDIMQVTFDIPPLSERIEETAQRINKFNISLESKVRDIKARYNNVQEDIKEARQRITDLVKRARMYSIELSALEKRDENKNHNEDLINLSQHPLFKNITVTDKEIVIYTNQINLIDPENSKNVFRGNEFKLVFDMINNSVRMFGMIEEYKHKGYWTKQDPHPHVDGQGGEACWGSVSSTIAELISEREIYALFIIVTNFLQTFNREDYAGKNIKNWTMLDGSENPYDEKLIECHDCGAERRSTDMYLCPVCGNYHCEDCVTYHDIREKYLCDSCYNASLYTCSECDSEYENINDLHTCAECGEFVCEDCAKYDDVTGNYYCEEHYDELIEDRKAELEVDTEDDHEENIQCDKCGAWVGQDALSEYINEEGVIENRCEGCM